MDLETQRFDPTAVLQQGFLQDYRQVDPLDVLTHTARRQPVDLLAHDADAARQFDVFAQFAQTLATDLAGCGEGVQTFQRGRQRTGHFAAKLAEQGMPVNRLER